MNADDPEAVVRACCLAADWRAAFHRDVVVDLVGYRRYGHNELDEPKLTLPFSHALIDQHKPVLELYAARLEQAGIASKANVTELRVSSSGLSEPVSQLAFVLPPIAPGCRLTTGQMRA